MSEPFRTKKSAQTFETILQAATELFRTKGFHGTTMRDLARASGLGLGALYYYFDSKEALVLRFYELNSRQTLESFRSTPESHGALADAVASFLRMKLADLTPYRDLIRVVVKEAIDPQSPLCPLNKESAGVLADNLSLYRELVERSKVAKGAEVQEWAQGLWMAQMAILTYWLHDRSPNFEATERAIEILKATIRLSNTITRVPGLGSLRKRIFGVVANLFSNHPLAASSIPTVPEAIA